MLVKDKKQNKKTTTIKTEVMVIFQIQLLLYFFHSQRNTKGKTHSKSHSFTSQSVCFKDTVFKLSFHFKKKKKYYFTSFPSSF